MDIQEALQQVNLYQETLPSKAINFLRDHETNQEILDAIIFAFENHMDEDVYYDEALDAWSFASISLSIVAEKHLDLQLAPAMVATLADSDNDYFNEQLEYLSQLMAKQFGGAFVSIVLDEIDAWLDSNADLDDSFLYLFDMFNYVDCNTYKEWISNYITDRHKKWREVLITNKGVINIDGYRKILDRLYLDALHGEPDTLRMGEIQYAYDVLDGKQEPYVQDINEMWEERFSSLLVPESNKPSIEREYTPSHQEEAGMFEEILENLQNAIREMPGRNDPCPCESGKKFKKCCLQKSGDIIELSKERDKLIRERVYLNEDFDSEQESVAFFIYFSMRTFEYVLLAFEVDNIKQNIRNFKVVTNRHLEIVIDNYHAQSYPHYTFEVSSYVSARKVVLEAAESGPRDEHDAFILEKMLYVIESDRPY